MKEKSVSLPQRLVAESLGTAFLLAAVVGSGIMAQRLAGGNGALALLCNTLPTGAILTGGGGFNRSAQHLLILRGEEVCHGDVADLVHGSAESRAVGAMEERAKCCGHLEGS